MQFCNISFGSFAERKCPHAETRAASPQSNLDSVQLNNNTNKQYFWLVSHLQLGSSVSFQEQKVSRYLKPICINFNLREIKKQ